MRSPSAPTREAGTSQTKRRPTRRRLSTTHLLIAVVVVLAFVLNFLALQERNATISVATADGAISAGTPLSGDLIRFVPIAADFEGLPSLVVESDLAALGGWVVQRGLPDGGLLQRSMLAAPASPSGFRSMSIPVDVEHAAGGTLGAGDRVDVISVVDGEARYVATDVEVLTVSSPDGGGLGSFSSYHLVLAVDDEEALQLAKAIDSGSIDVIRSTGAPPVDRGSGTDGS